MNERVMSDEQRRHVLDEHDLWLATMRRSIPADRNALDDLVAVLAMT